MPYIQDYHSKPSFNLLGKSPYGIFFGVEVEVEVGRDDDDRDLEEISKEKKAEHVSEALGSFAITKHDGSLNYGFEICTSPASVNFHETAWDKMFDESVVKNLKGYGTTTAGMHVHISRDPLSSLQIGKMISFIHNPENAKFIRRIAQRDSNKYNDFSKAKKTSCSHEKNLLNQARHTAVNLTNANTVEIRIFKSNLKKDSILRNIEFCAALVEFTWTSTRSIASAQSCKEFLRFVRSNRKFFPRLFSYLVKNKYIISSKINKYIGANKVLTLQKYQDEIEKVRNNIIAKRLRREREAQELKEAKALRIKELKEQEKKKVAAMKKKKAASAAAKLVKTEMIQVFPCDLKSSHSRKETF